LRLPRWKFPHLLGIERSGCRRGGVGFDIRLRQRRMLDRRNGALRAQLDGGVRGRYAQFRCRTRIARLLWTACDVLAAGFLPLLVPVAPASAPPPATALALLSRRLRLGVLALHGWRSCFKLRLRRTLRLGIFPTPEFLPLLIAVLLIRPAAGIVAPSLSLLR
jgi:hypothetical protein